MMSENLKNFLKEFAIVVALSIFFFFLIRQIVRTNKPQVQLNNKEYKALQKKYDSLQSLNLRMKDTIEINLLAINNLKNYDSALMQQYKGLKAETIKIKQYYENKISNLSNYSISQLQSEFTKRYQNE
jgi:hypothetical protein